jgi:hypothetical protein
MRSPKQTPREFQPDSIHQVTAAGIAAPHRKLPSQGGLVRRPTWCYDAQSPAKALPRASVAERPVALPPCNKESVMVHPSAGNHRISELR